MRYSADNLPKKDVKIEHTLNKYMFIKKGGEAWHVSGADQPSDTLDCEAIHIYGEDGEYWVGMYCEGLGLIDIRYLKTDCREATEEEVKWITEMNGPKVWAVKF